MVGYNVYTSLRSPEVKPLMTSISLSALPFPVELRQPLRRHFTLFYLSN